MFRWRRHRGERTSDGATQPAPARRPVSALMVKARLEPHQGSTRHDDVVKGTSVIARTYNAPSLAAPAASMELI